MNTIRQINFKDRRAVIRVDFNVPLDEEFHITDDTRIKGALPTIKKILSDGGSAVIMSHLGRPKDGPTNKYSLVHLMPYLIGVFGKENVIFSDDCISQHALNTSKNLKSGQIHLLENLRFYKEEEKGDPEFAGKLSEHGNIYVNDAFGTAHRAHASTAVIAQYYTHENKVFGLLMEGEIASAEKVLHQSEKPFTAIIGGAKVSDKILIIENLLQRATDIIIGGGMAYTFFKAQGKSIGNSICEDDRLEMAAGLLKKASSMGVNIHLPSDSIIADAFSAEANTLNCKSSNIPDGWMGLDIGEHAQHDFKSVILKSKTILWNGPMGVFEMEKFQAGTKAIADAVAEATKLGSFSLVGGGDSVAAVNQFGYADQVSYVSTGGGAMLEYFEGKILPGIKAIMD